jgi:hypothetical protein
MQEEMIQTQRGRVKEVVIKCQMYVSAQTSSFNKCHDPGMNQIQGNGRAK